MVFSVNSIDNLTRKAIDTDTYLVICLIIVSYCYDTS